MINSLPSADQSKIASFTQRCFLRIDDLARKRRNEIQQICSGVRWALGFSRDGTKLYYERGKTGMIGYTPEEFRKEAQERGYGLRSVDLTTGADRLVIPWSLESGPLFWHNPNVHREKRLVLVGKEGDAVHIADLDSDWADGLEIKRLSNLDFDYLRVDEVRRLPTLRHFRAASRGFHDAILSVAGDGIFYQVSPPDMSGKEMGFYDIEEGRAYFPLPLSLRTPIPRPTGGLPEQGAPWLLAALSRDALFYTVGVNRVTSKGFVEPLERRLYRLSADGTEMLIDTTKRGEFVFIGTP